jgi:SAM-dependent methyltransferase
VFVKFLDNEVGIRCLRCRATPITLSLIEVLRGRLPGLADLDVYEMSSRGPLVKYLGGKAKSVTTSEYFDDVLPGHFRDGVQCQDVTALTFADECFDLCTSTEVFEHVPDDAAAFNEVRRVLRPGGRLMFTVPIGDHPTVIRARADSKGNVIHLQPPEYHSDRLRGEGKVLCFRNYGTDIVSRLTDCGFEEADLIWPKGRWFGVARRVVLARKGMT